MIKANELKKHNLVYFENINVGVRPSGRELIELKYFTSNKCIGQDFDCALLHEVDFKQVAPIPLTEEWLVKFGFELNGEDYSIANFMFEIRKKLKSYSDVFVLFHDSNDMDEIMEIVEISHVHQLQNLYFALTSQELELKQ
jgi:hypothetical protein